MSPDKKPAPSEPREDPGKIYEQLVQSFSEAVRKMQAGDLEAARDAFKELCDATTDEPYLTERARTYQRICERRMAPATGQPASADERYYSAVMKANDGDTDAALRLLGQAIEEQPREASYFYARASAYALQGKTDAALGDLRQAIQFEPQYRFQAVNDPDFEGIREEPGFIDIIEPTPSGA